MKRFIPILMLAFAFAACQDEGPTQPVEGPQFAKPSCPGHPSCKDDDGGAPTAQIELCAKGSVIDYINSKSDADLSGKEIASTEADCVIPDPPPNDEASSLRPSGTLTYTTAGPEFGWKFRGDGFVPIDHYYVLIYYPDLWPGQDLICLNPEGARANRGGKLRMSGTEDLGDLSDAKMWIVRRAWVDCTGQEWGWNPTLTPRLTNDADYRDGWPDGPDATFALGYPYNGGFAYDWLFENALITYDDTDVTP